MSKHDFRNPRIGDNLVWFFTERMLRLPLHERFGGKDQELLSHLIGILYLPFVLHLGRQRQNLEKNK